MREFVEVLFLDIPNKAVKAVAVLIFLCRKDWDGFMRVLFLSFSSFGFHCKQPCDTKSGAGLALISLKRE